MKKISVFVAILIILILLSGPVYILRESLENKPGNQTIRRHWNMGNTTRILQPVDTNISKILYPAKNPELVVLIDEKRPIIALSALGLQQPIFFVKEELTPGLEKEIKRLDPSGMSGENDVQILLLGKGLDKVKAQLRASGFRVQAIDSAQLDDLAITMADKVISRSNLNDKMILVKEDLQRALPVSTWLVHYGLPVLFIDDSLSQKTEEYLAKWSKEGTGRLYYVGERLKDSQKDKLAQYGELEQITDSDPVDLSLKIARYYDYETNFGWWANGETPAGGHNFILANPEGEKEALLASQLSMKGKFGPLLYTYRSKLPIKIEKYYWEMKPNFWVTPTEGPYNHTWIIGDREDVNYPVQGRVDFLSEIVPYATFGAQGISGLEVIFLLWIISGILGCIWIIFHLFIRQPMISYLMKLAWIIVVLITGPIGVWAYYQTYKGYGIKIAMGDWQRPLWVQALVSTISSLAFGAGAMIAIAYLLLRTGTPLLMLEGPLFVFGNAMLLAMIISYLGAFLLNSLLFVPNMLRMGKRMNYLEAIRESIPLVFLSMTAVSIGMMGSMWWFMMEYLPMMPEESEILWFGFTYLATVVGLITAYPVNWLLVRGGLKKGRM